jgi:hypothetical protein
MGRLKNGRPPDLLTVNAKLTKAAKGYKGGEPVKLPDGRGIETTGLALVGNERQRRERPTRHASRSAHAYWREPGLNPYRTVSGVSIGECDGYQDG